MTPGGVLPRPDLVVVVGDVGGSEALRSLEINEFCTHPFTVKWHPWVSAETGEMSRIAAMLVEADPIVVCFGSDLPAEVTLTLTRHIGAIVPTTEVVMLAEPTPDAWATASRAGVREIISPASGVTDLSLAIDAAIDRAGRLRQHVVRPEPAHCARGRVIVVLSPKGGSGKTMLAVNMAVSLARMSPGRVALLDFDCQFGDVATSFGMEPDRTLTELPSVPHLDAYTVKLFLTQDEASSLFVLPASGRPSEADLVDEVFATRLIDLLAGEFDHIVIDTAAGIDERSLAAIATATDLVFVASMDVSSVRNLVKELEIIDQLGVTLPNRHFVLNRFDPKSGLRVDDIEAAVGMPVRHRVEASSAILSAMNQGRPMTLTDRGSSVVRPIEELAAEIHGSATNSAGGGGTSFLKSLLKRR